jgi:sigma-B regulation protein RsbU (phosphoserine phosphatase)
MKTVLSMVPQKHMPEFIQRYTCLIKSRVKLFCILSIVLYISATALSLLISPDEFRPQEIPIIIALIIGASVIMFLNKKADSLLKAKINAYLFTIFLLALITKLNIIYFDFAELASSIYVFILLFVVFAIPWIPFETIILALLHAAAYALFFLYLKKFIPDSALSSKSFLEGLVFLLAGLIFSASIIRKEAIRDTENFTMMKDIQQKNESMRKELELATHIHKTLVPKSMCTDLVDVAVMYLPVSFLGGDYAHFHFVDKDKLLFIICDVTGHGVSAALLVNRLHAEFERLSKDGKEPGVLLKELDNFIGEDFEGTNMYLSAFCGLLNFKESSFIYSNHGHPTQYLYRVHEDKIIGFSSQATLLGLPNSGKDIHQHKVSFEKNDKILMFTDGVIETMNARREQFDITRLESFILASHHMQPSEFNQNLMDELTAFKSGDFNDDIFLLTIAIK